MPAISRRLIGAAFLALALPFTATACGGGGDAGGKLVIGTKFDQPGLGLKKPDGTMTGFDVDVAKYVRSCQTCQRVKTEHDGPRGLLHEAPSTATTITVGGMTG